MRILTEQEYENRLEKARQEGWNKRCEVSERDEFRESLWRAIRESRHDMDRQIETLTKTLVKAGLIEDPFEPRKCCTGSEGSISCTPVNKKAGY